MNLEDVVAKRDPFYDITSSDLISVLTQLQGEYQILLDIICVDNQDRSSGSRFELIYLVLSMQHHHRLGVRIRFNDGEVIPSVSDIWPNASGLESEVWDMMGIHFSSGNKKRVLTHEGFSGFPLRKDFKHRPFKKAGPFLETELDNYITIHPDHLAMEGGLRLSTELDGEIIKSCHLESGFLHRGIEKICEDRNFNQIIPLAERLNHNSSALNGVGWVKAIEDHLDLAVSDRSKVLRMIFCELSRIMDHLLVIEKIAISIDANTVRSICSRQRDLIASLFSSYCGTGLLGNIARIGGLRHDIPMGWISECYEKTQLVRKNINKLYKQIYKSRIWMERTRVCSLTPQTAIDLGCTGPCLRACGINYDIRKASPYYFYRDLEFEIPLGLNGDAYDRTLVRVEECLQSIFMIGQLLDNVPVGTVSGLFEQNSTELDKIVLMEKGESYSSIESANGELGFYLVTDGSNTPYRLKIRPPSFSLLQAFPAVATGSTLGDALLSLKSLNIVAGELDR